jgi:uncharacterized protein (TIGR03083 family)
MRTDEHIAHLRQQGAALASAAGRGDLDAEVPLCPGWTLREVVHHTGRVHRWARRAIAERVTAPFEARLTAGSMPDDADLVAWYVDALDALAAALEATTDADDFWSFGPARSPLAFWARRQAHEVTIHRTDAERAGGEVTPVPAAFALDGIDEMLDVFVVPRKSLRSPQPRTLGLQARDTDTAWTVTIGPTPVTVQHAGNSADCTVSAPASDLFLLLWNRRGRDGLDITGDASLLDLWTESVRVRMSGE